jgi:hypothetical protein
MKIAVSAPVIWLVLIALADPVAAKIDTSKRPAVAEMRPTFDVIEARTAQGLWAATKGMRLALAARKTNCDTAKSPEDESSPKPTDIIIETEHHH